MRDSEHEQLRDAAGPWALGALELDERIAFEAHAVACAPCAAQARAMGDVACCLARMLPSRRPPARTRARILSTVSGR